MKKIIVYDRNDRAAIERMRDAPACEKHHSSDLPEAYWFAFGGAPGRPSAPCDACTLNMVEAARERLTKRRARKAR